MKPALLLLLLATNALALSPGQNIIKNGDFESSSQHWQLEQPLEWSEYEGVDGSGAILMNAQAAPDDGYIRDASARQCIPIENAIEFDLSASFRYDSLPIEKYGHELNILWYQDHACSSGGQLGTFVRPRLKEGWQTLYELNIKAGLNAKSALIVLNQDQHNSARKMNLLERFISWILSWFGLPSPFSLAHGYWDNITLTPLKLSKPEPINTVSSSRFTLPLGENYLKNSSFDQNIQHWRKHAEGQWSAEDGYQNPGALLGTIVSTSGSRGMGVSYQCVNFDIPQIFEMGIRFKKNEASSQTGGGRYRVTWYGDQNCEGQSKADTNHIDPTSVSGWQNLVVKDLQPPVNAKSVRVTIIQSVDGPGAFSAYWDDAYFKAVKNL